MLTIPPIGHLNNSKSQQSNELILTHVKNEKLQSVCEAMLSEQISYVSIVVIEKDKIFSGFSDNKWQETYFNNGLYLYDPVFKAAIRAPGVAVLWSSLAKSTKKSASVMRIRCDNTDIKHAVSISFCLNDRISIINLGTKHEESVLLEVLEIMRKKEWISKGMCNLID